MGIPCSELLRLPGAEGLEIIGGMTGLSREIIWVHHGDGVGDINELHRFLNGHELVLLTGKGLDGGTQDIMELLPRLCERDSAGLVINVGPHIPTIPEELIALADKLALPLFRLPWKYKLVDVTRVICNAIIASERADRKSASLLEEILFGTPPGEELPELLAGVGLESGEEYTIGVLGTDPVSVPGSTKRALSRRKRLYSAAVSAFAEMELDAIFLQRGSRSLVFLCVAVPHMGEKLRRIVQLVDKTMKKAHGTGVHMGVGREYSSSDGLRRSYTQARQAAKCSRSGELTSYSELGIDSLLLDLRDQERLEELYQETMRPILAYDRSGGSNLYETLDTYFACNMDAVKAAEAMFVHKNTVRYRVGKIEELMGVSLHDLQTVMLLGVCLKIGRLLRQEDE